MDDARHRKTVLPLYSEKHKVLLDSGADDVTMRDAVTGQTKWVYRESKISCPLPAEDAVYVSAYGGKIIALDWSTGKEKATYFSPVIGNPRNSPEVTSSGVHAEIGGKILTADRTLGHDLWKYEETADMWIDDIEASGDTLVLSTHNGKVKALSGKDGKILWTYTTPSFGLLEGNMAIEEGVVYIASKDGSVYALDLATGKNLWATKLDDGTAWSPQLTGSMLITADKSHIHGIDKKTGKKLWKKHDVTHQRILAIAGQAIFASGTPTEGWVQAHDAATGEIDWIFSGKLDRSFLAASPTHVYVRTDNEIQAYELTTKTAH